MFICGSGSFGNEDEHVEKDSPCHTPKKSRRSTNKNPFADRGLDKFYALLADLDDKKQKIYTQKGSEDISFVRFVYANDSDKAKPIVVKAKEKKQENNVNGKNMIKHPSNKSIQVDSGNTSNTLAAADVTKEETKKKRSLRCDGSFKMENFLQPYYYFPVMVVLILMFLAIYGRSFAILCTSIGWYLAPTIVGGSSSSSSERKPKRKKEYVRKQSDVKEKARSEGPSSPKSVINGLTDNLRLQQQQQHGRKKSW